MTNSAGLRRFIDSRVRYWCKFYDTYYDAGVKGMKKGQHVMARDPEYVQELKGGGGGGAKPGQKKQLQRPSALKRAAVIGGSIAGATALGLLGRKVGRAIGNRMASASKTASAARKIPSSKVEYIKPSKPSTSSFKKKKGNPFSQFTNTRQVQRNLNNPNHVWDI